MLGEVDEDKFGSTTLNFTYELPSNPNFPNFIYNIKYMFDGVVGYTERDSVSFPIHDMRNHTLQIYFGGELFEYRWKGGDVDINVILPTKSLQSQVYWKNNMTLATDCVVNLWIYNGISMWMKIIPLHTDGNGFVSIDALISGKYFLWEVNEKVIGVTTFLLEQGEVLYTNDILIG